MEDEDWSEYGIRKQEFDLPFEVQKWVHLGKAVSDAVDATFPKEVM